MSSDGKANLRMMFERADAIDVREGLLAYQRYHQVMLSVSAKYGIALPRVAAAFCALSPNNDYVGNLRSLLSLCDGLREGRARKACIISSYGHCGDRAWSYLTGKADFLSEAKGLKIRSFYHNILNPDDNRWVTIDGHVCAAWRGKNLTMKEALVKSKREYVMIADAVKALAFEQFMLPNQYQAVLWFARKRTLGIKCGRSANHDLFNKDDVWCTLIDIDRLRSFPNERQGLDGNLASEQHRDTTPDRVLFGME